MLQKIVAVGAHPDDIELGCAGSLKKFLAKGDEVFYIMATNGEKGGDSESRLKEMHESMRILGVKKENLSILELPDTMIRDDGNTVTKIEEILKKISPDMIMTACPSDKHQDHRNLSSATVAAARHMKATILFYETPTTTIDFRPTAFIDISDVIEEKIKALEAYRSQNNKYFMLNESVVGLSKFRGQQIHVKHAEAFEVNKMILRI